jgi:DNA transposition AAA+ family ATPase
VSGKLIKSIDDIVVNHKVFSQGLETLHRYYDLKESGYDKSIGIAIIGESGMGKTTLIETFMQAHPKIITETQDFCPITLVSIPTRPKGGSLCDAILEGLGDPVKSSSGDVREKITRIVNLLKVCKTSVLILDEMQHFVNRWNGRDAHDAGDTLKEILKRSNVMLVCCGLEYGVSLFKQNEQLLRRFSRSIKFDRFDWNIQESRSQFRAMLKAIQTAMSSDFKVISLSSNEMAFRLFVASGGIIGYVKELIKEAALNAHLEDSAEINMQHFAEAFKTVEFAVDRDGTLENPFIERINPSNLASLISGSKSIGVSNIDKENLRVKSN